MKRIYVSAMLFRQNGGEVADPANPETASDIGRAMRMRHGLVLGVALILGALGVVAYWNWSRPPPLLNPIASVPFDVSQKGASAEMKVRIPQYRSWVIVVSFVGLDHDGLLRMNDIFYGNRDKSIAPLTVPIQVVVTKTESDGSSQGTIYKTKVSVITPYAFGAHDYEAQVAAINLHPGLYKVSVATLAEIPELTDFKASLEVEYRAQVQFIPYAVTPTGDK